MTTIFQFWAEDYGEKFDTNDKNTKMSLTSFLACCSKLYEETGNRNPFITNYNTAVELRSPHKRKQLINMPLVE
jgi:hypothetical protein